MNLCRTTWYEVIQVIPPEATSTDQELSPEKVMSYLEHKLVESVIIVSLYTFVQNLAQIGS